MRREISRLWIAIVFVFVPSPLFAQSPVQLRFESVPAAATQHVPIPVQLIALDSAGARDTTFQGTVPLSARRRGSASVVISEISGDGTTLEFTHPGETSINISGWELEVGHRDGYPIRSYFHFPPSSVVAPRTTFTWSSSIQGPGAFPEFGAGTGLGVLAEATLATVQLRDSEGDLVDSVLLSTDPSRFVLPGWFGAPLGYATNNYTDSLQRVGSVDTSTQYDWVTNSPSIGVINPGLNLPWQGRPTVFTVTPSSVQLVNGVWQGAVTIPETGDAVTLVAMAADGRLFESSPIQVAPGPTLRLQIPAAALDASESAAGALGTVVVSRPTPTAEPLVVSLSLDQPGEFSLPETLIIPAGTDSASFTLTNLDDAVADGQARVRLTASAPGLVSAESWLLNDDNEIGSVFLLTPAALVESAGNLSTPGEVVLSEPARHDVVVRLASDPVLEVPPSVVILAGSNSATFPIRAVNDQIFQRYGARWYLRAWISDWPAAEQSIQIFDDEFSPPEFDLPESIVEGESVSVHVRFPFPCAFDRVLTFSEASIRLELPGSVRIPAMATEASFVVRVRDNLALNWPEPASFQAIIDDASYKRVGIMILDNEAVFSGVTVAMPSAVFAGEPVPLQIQLVNDHRSVARTNLQGEATLSPSADSTVYPLSFSNGIFAGSLTFPAVAVDTSLSVSVGTLRQEARHFDVVEGRRVAGPFADLAAAPSSSSLVLALGGATTHYGSTLIEIDARTGFTNRTLALPRVAQLLTVSDSGQTAWCASTNGMLQRVHLPDFSLKEEVNLVRPGVSAFPIDLVVLAGTEDRLLVLSVITNLALSSPWQFTQLIAVSNGVRLPIGTNFYSIHEHTALAAGPDATQAIIDIGGGVRLLTISADGVRFGAGAPVALPFDIPIGNMIRVGDRFFRGSGDALTVSPLTYHASELQPGVVAAAEGYRVYLGTDGNLRVFDQTRDLLLGTHRVPWPEAGGLAPRLVATLDRTFAALLPDRSALHLWRSPVASSIPADLAIEGQGMGQVSVSPFDPVMTPWNWIVTNRGPGTAYRVAVTTDRGLKYDLGTLPKGASRSIEDPRYIGILDMLRGRAHVESPTSDPRPEDNTAEFTTAVVYHAPPWTTQWLGVRDIAPSADGASLWIVQTPPGTVTNTVVSTIEPETGKVTAILEHPDLIDRLHPTTDGRFLYLRIGTTQVARWNLAERRFNLQLTSEHGPVMDVLPLPGEGHAFVVASAQQISVFDDAVARPNVISTDADFRFLTFAADHLWVHEPLKLVPYRVTPQGLEPDGDAIAVRSDLSPGPFTSDGRRLFGHGSIVDLATRQAREEWELGWIVPDLAGRGLYALENGPDVVRLDPETLQPASSQPFLGPNQMPLQMTRCGPDALAFRFDSGVLWIKSYPLIATPGGGDIAVSIAPPAPLVSYATQDYHITITNHSDVAAHRIELECRLGDFLRLSTEVPNEFQEFASHVWLRLDALAPHGSKTLTLPLLQFPGPMSLEVQVRSGDLGDDPANNVATVTGSIDNPSGNLALSLLTAPTSLTAPSEFNVRLRVTNSAEVPVNQLQLRLERSPGLELLSASPGTIPTECCGPEDFMETVVLNPLAAKTSTDLELRYRIALPGVFRIGAVVEALVTNNSPADDRLSLVLSAPPHPTTPGLAPVEFPRGAFAWLEGKEKLFAVFEGHPALVELGPEDLQMRRQVPLSGNPAINRARLAVAADGRRAWALSEKDQIVQVNLLSGTVEAQFPNPLTPPSSMLPYAGLTFATVPNQPEMLLIAGVTEPRETQILAFHKGAALPTRHRYASFQHGANPAMHVTTDGRLFVLAENQLAEFEVSESGVSEKRRIANVTDRLGPLSSAGSRLVVSGGPAFDLGSLPPIPVDAPGLRWFGVPELSLVFRYPAARTFRDSVNNQFIETLEPENFEVLRRREIRPEDWPTSDILQEISLGRHGLILQGAPALWFKNAVPEDLPDADLSVTVDAALPIATLGEPVTLPLVVSHAGSRTSRNALLEVTLPPDVELVEASAPFTNRNTARTFALGHLARTHRTVSLVLKASRLGTQPLQFRVLAETTDPNPANDVAEATLRVFPAPEVIVRDVAVNEGSDFSRPPYYPVYLSHPSPKGIEIPFRVVPITASASDLSSTEGVATFAPGVTVAAAYFIRPNTQKDPDRTVRFELGDTPIPAQRRSALVTIVDDETPAISVGANSVPEGQSGIQWGNVTLELRHAASEPMDISYRLELGTATAGEDYRPESGWVRFEPGQTNRTIPVPIFSDTRYETAETVRIILTDTAGLEWDGIPGSLTLANDDAPATPTIEFVRDGNSLRLIFDSVPGARYRVQYNTRLGRASWAFEPGILIGTGQPLTWTVPIYILERQPVFYRVRVE